MAEDIDRKISGKYCNRFGIIAVDKGFVTADQLKEALTEQADDNLSNKPHRLIGRIFFEKGWRVALLDSNTVWKRYSNL